MRHDRNATEGSPKESPCEHCSLPPSIKHNQNKDEPWSGLHIQEGNEKDLESHERELSGRIKTVEEIVGSVRV